MERKSMLYADVALMSDPLYIWSVRIGRSIQLSALMIITSPAEPVYVGELCVIWFHAGLNSDHDPSVKIPKVSNNERSYISDCESQVLCC